MFLKKTFNKNISDILLQSINSLSTFITTNFTSKNELKIVYSNFVRDNYDNLF